MNDSLENVESIEDLTPEAKAVLENVDIEHIQDRLEGRGGGLRSSKPQTDSDNGMIQYVWRMARFHSGADTSMPVTASWWLQDYLENQGIEASVSGITDKEGKQITAILDVVARLVVDSFGGDPHGGVKRWQKAIYG